MGNTSYSRLLRPGERSANGRRALWPTGPCKQAAEFNCGAVELQENKQGRLWASKGLTPLDGDDILGFVGACVLARLYQIGVFAGIVLLHLFLGLMCRQFRPLLPSRDLVRKGAGALKGEWRLYRPLSLLKQGKMNAQRS